jgi:hypothetical protein
MRKDHYHTGRRRPVASPVHAGVVIGGTGNLGLVKGTANFQDITCTQIISVKLQVWLYQEGRQVATRFTVFTGNFASVTTPVTFKCTVGDY